MCLITKKDARLSIQRDKVDRVVYKVFKTGHCGQILTPFKDRHATPIMEASRFSFQWWDEVHRGIHAFVSARRAKEFKRYAYGERIIVRCIIPAGTPYIRGIDRDIVSLKLILWEEI